MKSIFYILGIVVTAAAAVFSFLTGEQHKELTAKTYETRKKNDAHLKTRSHKRGENLRQVNTEGEEVKGDAAGAVVRMKKGQALTGLKLYTNFNPDQNNEAVVLDGLPYSAYNVTLANASSMNKQKEYIEADADEVISGAARQQVAEEINRAVKAYITQTLANKIRQVSSDIELEEGEKEGLLAKIDKYKQAEEKIKKMFAGEGITTLEGGKEKYAQLAKDRKDRVGEEETLTEEQADFKKSLAKNEHIIGNQQTYFNKRKVSLTTNEKKFSIKSVDFDWGFVVVKGDSATKFFINQKLMILRGNSYIGDVTVSSIEPGRVVANIDYKSIKEGFTLRKGDFAILAEPADR